MKESRFVVTVNHVLNVIFASGLLVLWLALLPNGTAFPPLRGKAGNKFYENYPQQNSACLNKVRTTHHVLQHPFFYQLSL
jgi:hypothetical protein